MTKPRIEPCPMPGCGAKCKLREDDGGLEYIECNHALCGYSYANLSFSKDDLIVTHNQLCERNRLGKLAEEHNIVTNELMEVFKKNTKVAKAAEELKKNPPFVKKMKEIDESNSGDYWDQGYSVGNNDGVQACLDMFEPKDKE